MMKCGLAHKWYLIEDFTKHVKHWNSRDTAVHGGRGFSHKALESAIAGTAALPGYALFLNDLFLDSLLFRKKKWLKNNCGLFDSVSILIMILFETPVFFYIYYCLLSFLGAALPDSP